MENLKVIGVSLNILKKDVLSKFYNTDTEDLLIVVPVHMNMFLLPS